MCVEVEIDGEIFQSVGQLSSVLPHLHFEPDSPLQARKSGYCLCSVDLKKTAEANGYVYRSTEDDFYAIFDRK